MPPHGWLWPAFALAEQRKGWSCSTYFCRGKSPRMCTGQSRIFWRGMCIPIRSRPAEEAGAGTPARRLVFSSRPFRLAWNFSEGRETDHSASVPQRMEPMDGGVENGNRAFENNCFNRRARADGFGRSPCKVNSTAGTSRGASFVCDRGKKKLRGIPSAFFRIILSKNPDF